MTPSFISSYAAIRPEVPAPMTATSSPCRSAGIEPRPAGWAIQSSNGNGKSGPKIVTGLSLLPWFTIVFLPDRVAAVDDQGQPGHGRLRRAVRRVLVERDRDQASSTPVTTATIPVRPAPARTCVHAERLLPGMPLIFPTSIFRTQVKHLLRKKVRI